MLRKLVRLGLAAPTSLWRRIKRPTPPTVQTTSKPALLAPLQPHRTHTPADGYVWSSKYGEVTVPDLTLDEYLWRHFCRWPDNVAVVRTIQPVRIKCSYIIESAQECAITGRRYTYAELRDHSAALAIRLRTRFQLQHGDVIAIAMPNIPEYALVALGAIEAGLTITTVNPMHMPGMDLCLMHFAEHTGHSKPPTKLQMSLHTNWV